MSRQPPSGLGRPHYWCFTITLRHTTLGMTPLDEWSARRRDLYLTTHNIQNRQSCPRQDPNPKSQQACCRRNWFQKYVPNETRITKNCIHVHLVQPVSCYQFSGRLFSFMLIYTSVFNLLYYRSMYPCKRGKWGVTNIADVFRDIPKAECWYRTFLCSISCSDNMLMHFFKNNRNIIAF
jgi:hypothetical protein